VSKKVSKSAVLRNRMRRRLYEAFRQHEAAFVTPYDMVVTVFHEQVATLPPDELTRLVAAQLRQAGILPAKSRSHRAKI
jgi:ribonuclease P protein component